MPVVAIMDFNIVVFGWHGRSQRNNGFVVDARYNIVGEDIYDSNDELGFMRASQTQQLSDTSYIIVGFSCFA